MSDPVRQAAAIAIREGRICLVTSSNGKRWVIPKGMIDPGHTAEETASIEAWEEAGIEGTIQGEPLGSYVYEKYGCEHHVLVFRMSVSEVYKSWPEKSLRQREWLTAKEAAKRVKESGLQEILRGLAKEGEGEKEPR